MLVLHIFPYSSCIAKGIKSLRGEQHNNFSCEYSYQIHNRTMVGHTEVIQSHFV